MWVKKRFNELTPLEVFQIYKARVAVFVVEQACPYPEVDDEDLTSVHVWYEEKGRLVAYARIIPKEDCVKIGRVIVAKERRGEGFGRALMKEVLTWIEEHERTLPIVLQAQTYLQPFYESFQFEVISDSYEEDGIPHIDMKRLPFSKK